MGKKLLINWQEVWEFYRLCGSMKQTSLNFGVKPNCIYKNFRKLGFIKSKNSNKTTSDDFDKFVIETFLKEKLTIRELSKKLKISRDIISRILQSANISIEKKNIAQYTKEIIDMYESTHSMSKVAEKYGVVITCIRSILRKNGIETSKGYNYRKGANSPSWKEDRELIKIKKKLQKIAASAFKQKGKKKKTSTKKLLGCSIEEFKNYIESLWEPWMNWENYGNKNGVAKEVNFSWDLDHIIPLSSAKTEEDLNRLTHYTNIQPLCSYTNRWVKRNKKEFKNGNIL